MIHIRTDSEELNGKRKFACGIGPTLPEGDKWVHRDEYGLHSMVDCPACNPARESIGWRASDLNGNASQRNADPQGWANWIAFCNANGHP